VREQTLLSTVLTELRKQLPFALLGLDADNDTVFMNETLKAYCDTANITFTRCRPYRKNDQAFVEQKNGAVVRKMVGYRRFEGLEAATLFAELYRSVRLLVNFFQPSFKLIAKRRDGARVRKTYSAPMTPHQRLNADVLTPAEVRACLQQIYAGLDLVVLLRDIRATQERLAALADVQPVERSAAAEQPIAFFLASLRTAWKDGAIRPTNRPIVKAKRERRRPDPLIQVTPDLRRWFEAEPWRTGSELLSRLQTEYPGAYPDKLLRTLQRRLKAWRSEKARASKMNEGSIRAVEIDNVEACIPKQPQHIKADEEIALGHANRATHTHPSSERPTPIRYSGLLSTHGHRMDRLVQELAQPSFILGIKTRKQLALNAGADASDTIEFSSAFRSNSGSDAPLVAPHRRAADKSRLC
jgi:hypothetical protein